MVMEVFARVISFGNFVLFWVLDFGGVVCWMGFLLWQYWFVVNVCVNM